jgi:signal transduction histidine kinase
VQTPKKNGSSSKRPTAAAVLVASLIAILVFLAFLQYNWSGQVSEAEHERMQDSLRASMDSFRFQLNSELLQLGSFFQPDAAVLIHRDWDGYAATCSRLMGTSYYRLVRDVYLWVTDAQRGEARLLRLNGQSRKFEVTPWPAEFESLRTRHQDLFSGTFTPERGFRPFGWSMSYQIPLMMHPLIPFQPFQNPPGAEPQFSGFVILRLNMDTIRKELFPELAKRYFKGPDGFVYHVAVVRRNGSAEILYKSDSNLNLQSFIQSDASVSLLENRRNRFAPDAPRSEPPEPRRPPPFQQESPPPVAAQPGSPPPGSPEPMERVGRPGIPIEDLDSSRLELLAKHREGSLEAAVAGSRRRNLALSFGILLLLAVSMALVIVFARRAQRLAKLQIEFVAGVSHELRTPLTVICSAGDNLAEGVVPESGDAARKYGELIRGEGRKLTAMIEQILAYASVRRGRRQYNLRPADINGIAEAALRETQPAIAAAGFSVERKFDSDLPGVNVDPVALSQAIGNLIQNALKYSGSNQWMSVRTDKLRVKNGLEIRLTVEDRGIGIDRDDLRHVFEPFYRGEAATAAQIHGTGLGLFMVREAVISMGGTVTIKSARGEGSAFTIHLPALPASVGKASFAGEGEAEHAVQNTTD